MSEVRLSSADRAQAQMDQAREGSPEALGRLLEDARGFLQQIAQQALDADLRGKLSASDLVQETMADAHRKFADFRGEDVQQLFAWLRRIMVNNVLTHYRRLRDTKKRDVRRERSVELDLLVTEGETPSAHAVASEETAAVAEELAKLPEHYRQLIELRHRDGLTFQEIGEQLGKSADAVRMIWYRAFNQLSVALERRLRD